MGSLSSRERNRERRGHQMKQLASIIMGTLVMCSSLDRSQAIADVVANPTLSGPIRAGSRGGAFGALSAEALASAGYLEHEYFFEGVAAEYVKVGSWEVDGTWDAAASGRRHHRALMRSAAWCASMHELAWAKGADVWISQCSGPSTCRHEGGSGHRPAGPVPVP
jgi:hypothetical protein